MSCVQDMLLPSSQGSALFHVFSSSYIWPVLPWQRIRFSPAFSSLLVLNSFAHMLSLTHFSPSAELLGPSFPCFADYFLTGRPQKPTYLSFFLFFLSNRYIPAKFLLTSHTHTLSAYLPSDVLAPPLYTCLETLFTAHVHCLVSCMSACPSASSISSFQRKCAWIFPFLFTFTLESGFTYWTRRAKFNPIVQGKACINMIHKYSIWRSADLS